MNEVPMALPKPLAKLGIPLLSAGNGRRKIKNCYSIPDFLFKRALTISERLFNKNAIAIE
jgi:hypothetical protein